MKLHHNPASPFVRIVRVTAHELGLADQIEEVHTGVFLPVEVHASVNADNPLGKIPALVTHHGTALYDSRVICEYLTHHAGDKTLLPDEPVARFANLTMQALAQGIADSAVNLRYESALRPEKLRWADWIERQTARINNALDALENSRAEELGDVNLGTISVACVLGYLDFRWPDWGWRDGRSKLAAFYEKFSAKPSMQATLPE